MPAQPETTTSEKPATKLRFVGVRGTLSLPFGWTYPVVSRSKVENQSGPLEYAIWTSSPEWIDSVQYTEDVEEGSITEVPLVHTNTNDEVFPFDDDSTGKWFVYYNSDKLAELSLEHVIDACVRRFAMLQWESFYHPATGRRICALVCTSEIRDQIRNEISASLKENLELMIEETWPNADWPQILSVARIWVDVTVFPMDAMDAISYAAMAMQHLPCAVQLGAWLSATCQRWPFSPALDLWEGRILSLMAKCESYRFQKELELRRRLRPVKDLKHYRPRVAGEMESKEAQHIYDRVGWSDLQSVNHIDLLFHRLSDRLNQPNKHSRTLFKDEATHTSKPSALNTGGVFLETGGIQRVHLVGPNERVNLAVLIELSGTAPGVLAGGVRQGDVLAVDLRSEVKDGEILTFDKILLANGGRESILGRPVIDGATVTAEIVKGIKLEIQKFKRRNASKRHTGHRQKYTRVKITGISVPGLQVVAAPAAVDGIKVNAPSDAIVVQVVKSPERDVVTDVTQRPETGVAVSPDDGASTRQTKDDKK